MKGISFFFIEIPVIHTVPQQVEFMKPRKLLPRNKFLNNLFRKGRSQRGQSIVEFVLLLSVITGLSYGFVAIMNRNLARYWDYSASLIVNDKPVQDERFDLSR